MPEKTSTPRGLYADRDGFLVEVTAVMDGTVQFAPQGGGFVRTASLASFSATFAPAKLPPYRAVRVEAEWLPPGMRLDAFGNGQRWNGWVMPYFQFEVGQQLCIEMPNLSYDPKRDAFVLLDAELPDDEQEQVFDAMSIDVAGKPLKVYGIGAGYWTWDEAD